MTSRLFYRVEPNPARVRPQNPAAPPVVNDVLAPWLAVHVPAHHACVEVRRVLRPVHPYHQRRLQPHRQWKVAHEGAGRWESPYIPQREQVTSLGVFERCPDGLFRLGLRSEAAQYQHLVEQAIREAHVRGVAADGSLFLTMGGVKFLNPFDPAKPWVGLTPQLVLPRIEERRAVSAAREQERAAIVLDPATLGMRLALASLAAKVSAWTARHGASVHVAAKNRALDKLRAAVKEARAAGASETDLRSCLEEVDVAPKPPTTQRDTHQDGKPTADTLRDLVADGAFRPSDWWAATIVRDGETEPTAVAIDALVQDELFARSSIFNAYLILPWTEEVQALIATAGIKVVPYRRQAEGRNIFAPRADLAQALGQRLFEGESR